MPYFGMADETDDDRLLKELVEINWNETSGVDHPANQEEGWLVMKSAEGQAGTASDPFEQLLHQHQVRIDGEERLFKAIQTTDLGDAPDDVRQAVAVVQTWLRGEGYGGTKPTESVTKDTGKLNRVLSRVFKSAEQAGADLPDAPTFDPWERYADDSDEAIEELVLDSMPNFLTAVERINALPLSDDDRAAAVSEALTALRADVEGPYEMIKRDFTDQRRKELARQGAALPDGSYQIVTRGDLQNAIRAIGRATNRAAVMAHICKRARALGAMDMIPDDWSCKKS